MSKDEDIEIIRDALKTWRCLMAAARAICTAGGQSSKALAALERIERRLSPRQLGLLEASDEN